MFSERKIFLKLDEFFLILICLDFFSLNILCHFEQVPHTLHLSSDEHFFYIWMLVDISKCLLTATLYLPVDKKLFEPFMAYMDVLYRLFLFKIEPWFLGCFKCEKFAENKHTNTIKDRWRTPGSQKSTKLYDEWRTELKRNIIIET